MRFDKEKFAPKGNLRYVLGVLAVLLLMNFVMRLVFLAGNYAEAGDLNFTILFKAFIVGIRFDIATIFILNGLIFLYLMLPIAANKSAKSYRVVNAILLAVNLPMFIINAIDVVYYSMSEKRLTHELFSTTPGEIFNIPIIDTVVDYWWLFLIFFAVSFGFIRWTRRISKKVQDQNEKIEHKSGVASWAFAVMVAAVIFTGIRGGLQGIPLRPSHAFVTDNRFAGILGLNSAYTIMASYVLSNSDEVKLVPVEDARNRITELVRNPFDVEFPDSRYPFVRRAEFDGPEKNLNVVYIILESFNAVNCGVINGVEPDQSLTPEFDKLSERGVLFTNFHSNATRSVEAIPAILNSIPDIFNRPIIGSDLETMNNWGIGNILSKRGYNSSFYHGGRNGTMGFDNYVRISGLKDYYGVNEYPNSEEDHDGMWGIYDVPFFTWWAQELGKKQQPFISVGFSISNHHPFRIPEKGNEDLTRSSLSGFKKTTKYSDRALGEFFRVAEKSDWYDQTVFVITADHTFHERDGKYRTILDLSHIPLLIIAPGLKPSINNRTSNQLDILPTMIQLLRLDTYHASAGHSLLSERQKLFAVTCHSGIYMMASNEYAWCTNFDQQMPCLTYSSGAWRKNSNGCSIPGTVGEQMDYDLRCFYQEARNCRIENRIISGKWMK